MKANTPYTISIRCISGYADIGGSFGVYSSLIGPFGTKLMCFLGQNNSATLTPTEDIVMDSLRIWISPDDIGKTFNNYTVQYQIEEGSVATDYQPYYGQITHNGDKEIEFAESERQKSKNLLNYEDIMPKSGLTTDNNGTFYIDTTFYYVIQQLNSPN